MGELRTLDLVFVGCGRATLMHSRTLSRMAGDVRLHYASRDARKAARFRKRFRGAGTFGSYQEALEDPEIDVVVVATPPALHLEPARQALRHGKHVIVEKPAFLGPEEFQEIREAASGSEGRVFVAENYFYKPLRERLCGILARGLIGDPLILQVTAVKRQLTGGWRDDAGLAGGGALMEGGIHWINLLSELGLEVKRATGYRAPGGARDAEETSVVVVLEYVDGPVASLSYSWDVPSPLKGLRVSRIYGREGTITFESNGVFVFVQGRRTRLYAPRPWDIAGYRGMFADFLEAIRTGREPRMTLEMAERDVRLVREIYHGMETV